MKKPLSGKWLQRVPKTLHAQLAAEAKEFELILYGCTGRRCGLAVAEEGAVSADYHRGEPDDR